MAVVYGFHGPEDYWDETILMSSGHVLIDYNSAGWEFEDDSVSVVSMAITKDRRAHILWDNGLVSHIVDMAWSEPFTLLESDAVDSGTEEPLFLFSDGVNLYVMQNDETNPIVKLKFEPSEDDSNMMGGSFSVEQDGAEILNEFFTGNPGYRIFSADYDPYLKTVNMTLTYLDENSATPTESRSFLVYQPTVGEPPLEGEEETEEEEEEEEYIEESILTLNTEVPFIGHVTFCERPWRDPHHILVPMDEPNHFGGCDWGIYDPNTQEIERWFINRVDQGEPWNGMNVQSPMTQKYSIEIGSWPTPNPEGQFLQSPGIWFGWKAGGYTDEDLVVITRQPQSGGSA